MGIEFCFAEIMDPVKDKLKRFGLFNRFGEKSFFATVGEAVNAYLEALPIEWTDWEDRQIRDETNQEHFRQSDKHEAPRTSA